MADNNTSSEYVPSPEIGKKEYREYLKEYGTDDFETEQKKSEEYSEDFKKSNPGASEIDVFESLKDDELTTSTGSDVNKGVQYFADIHSRVELLKGTVILAGMLIGVLLASVLIDTVNHKR